MAKIIGIIAVIALVGGGYWYWTSMNTSTNTNSETQPAAAASATDTTATTQEQVQGQDVTVGTGREAAAGSLVSVLYVGALTDGTVFDSSEAHNNEPLKFVLGAPGMIPGFQVGVNGMKEGGERRIAIPASLAYGAQEIKDPSGKVIIPANSMLIFDIKLLKVEDAPQETAQ